MREFFIQWHEHGLRVAIYNLLFITVHRNDDHVRVWQRGEKCSGCPEGDQSR